MGAGARSSVGTAAVGQVLLQPWVTAPGPWDLSHLPTSYPWGTPTGQACVRVSLTE